LSQYRRELGERGGAALVPQRSATSRKGAFACRAGRHPRDHRGATVLPRSLLHSQRRLTAPGRLRVWLRSESRRVLHACHQALVLATFRENLGDVGALEAASLWRGDEQFGNVLPPFILLEGLDLAMQAEEVIGQVRIDAEAFESSAEWMLGGGLLQQTFTGGAALAEAKGAFPHLLFDLGRRTEMESGDRFFWRAVHQEPLGHVAARNCFRGPPPTEPT